MTLKSRPHTAPHAFLGALALLGLLLSGGCMAPKGRAIQLLTVPEGADFETSWGETGVTPCEIRVPERGEIRIRHTDCEDRDVQLEPARKRHLATLTMVAFGFLLDPFSEPEDANTLQLQPDQRELHVILEPETR